MHQRPAAVWPTKIILKLLAANLSTKANQLSATSVLLQQNQHGDCKQNDMANFAEALFRAPTKSEWNLWVDFLVHPEQYANTCMAVLIRRVTCESLFSFWGQRKVLSWKIGSLRIDDFRTTTPLDCVTGLLRMLVWALAGVAPKSTPLLTAIRRRRRKSRTWD